VRCEAGGFENRQRTHSSKLSFSDAGIPLDFEALLLSGSPAVL
jgi:hypothetical protein